MSNIGRRRDSEQHGFSGQIRPVALPFLAAAALFLSERGWLPDQELARRLANGGVLLREGAFHFPEPFLWSVDRVTGFESWAADLAVTFAFSAGEQGVAVLFALCAFAGFLAVRALGRLAGGRGIAENAAVLAAFFVLDGYRKLAADYLLFALIPLFVLHLAAPQRRSPLVIFLISFFAAGLGVAWFAVPLLGAAFLLGAKLDGEVERVRWIGIGLALSLLAVLFSPCSGDLFRVIAAFARGGVVDSVARFATPDFHEAPRLAAAIALMPVIALAAGRKLKWIWLSIGAVSLVGPMFASQLTAAFAVGAAATVAAAVKSSAKRKREQQDDIELVPVTGAAVLVAALVALSSAPARDNRLDFLPAVPGDRPSRLLAPLSIAAPLEQLGYRVFADERPPGESGAKAYEDYATLVYFKKELEDVLRKWSFSDAVVSQISPLGGVLQAAGWTPVAVSQPYPVRARGGVTFTPLVLLRPPDAPQAGAQPPPAPDHSPGSAPPGP